MDKKKLVFQILSIAAIIVMFLCADLFVYYNITKIYVNNYGDKMAEKSIDIDSYLPFKEDSLIVKETADTKITENIPSLDGATALYPIYSAFVNALYPEESLKYDGKEFLEDSKIFKTGTGTAYKRIVDGDVDVIFCAGPSKKQLEYAASKGVELELIPIGYESFVFIVNKNNSVDNLTVDQLKDIYRGKITNWQEVGGENTPIIALQRAEGSGSQTAMQKFMGGEEMPVSSSAVFGKRIGYSFRYYVESIVNDSNIKMLSLNGVAPTKETIKNKTYPIADTFYMIYRKDNTNPNIEVLKDFILSEKGQKIIEDTGYVSVN